LATKNLTYREIDIHDRNYYSPSREASDRAFAYKIDRPVETFHRPYINKSLPHLPNYPIRYNETTKGIIKPSYEGNYRRFNEFPPQERIEPKINIHASSKPRVEKVYTEKMPHNFDNYDNNYAQHTEVSKPDRNSVNFKSTSNFKILPSDRVYEIRKEKIMIKADRGSQSPLHKCSRHKSVENNLNIESNGNYEKKKNNYILVDQAPQGFVPNEPKVYSKSSSNLNGSRKPCPTEISEYNKRYNQSSELNDEYAVISSLSRRTNNVLPSENNMENLNKSDIIYVPMIKDEFILRETIKKTNVLSHHEYA
jgi:hypothetical protein